MFLHWLQEMGKHLGKTVFLWFLWSFSSGCYYSVRHAAYAALAWLAVFPLTYFLILLLWLLALVLGQTALGQLSSLLHEF